MKPQLLHGPAISASRKKLQELKKRFNPENIVVFEEKADIQQILTNLQSQSIFEGERLIIVENPSEDFISDLSLVTCHLSLILWFDHEINQKKWLGFEYLFFPEAKEVSAFLLLDYLAAGDQKSFLEIEKLNNAGFDIFYYLTMVLYLLRNLVATPKNAPDFVRNKLTKQRSRFNNEALKNLYRNILEIDFKIKSGLLEKKQAEFLLVNTFFKNQAL